MARKEKKKKERWFSKRIKEDFQYSEGSVFAAIRSTINAVNSFFTKLNDYLSIRFSGAEKSDENLENEEEFENENNFEEVN